MRGNMIGMFAISLAGHDKGQMYVIIDEDKESFYLADGDLKSVTKPKKKNKKHVQPIKSALDEALVAKLQNKKPIYNEEIKFAIKQRTK